MPSDTERAVYVQRIDPDRKDEYREAHESVPEGVSEAMRRGTATSFELYVRDDVAVCIVEAENLDAYLDAVDGDEGVEDWERHVAQFKREGVDVDDDEEPIPFMERVWTLSDGPDA